MKKIFFINKWKIVNNLIIYLCGDSVTVIYVDNKIGLCISLEKSG